MWTSIAQRGEAIYRQKYQAELESTQQDKFVAINIRNEGASVAATSSDAVRLALEKDPTGFFHLIRIGHRGAFRT